MIYEAAEIVKHLISDLTFVGNIEGLVKTFERKDQSGNTERFPIAWNTEESECKAGRYINLVPDSTKKGAIYFEGDRMNIVRDGGRITFEGDLKLVCWLNLRLMSPDALFTPYAIAQVLQAIPAAPFNYSPEDDGNYKYQRVIIRTRSVEQDNVFSKYTYGKRVSFYPFDFFAINLNMEFRLNNSCFTIPAESADTCESDILPRQFDSSFDLSFM